MEKKIFNEKYVSYLTENDFDENIVWEIKDKSNCVLIMFFAPWCPYCKQMKNVWEEFAQIAGFAKIYVYDIEENRSHFDKILYELPSLVTSYPTIIFYKKGKPFEKFNKERTLKNLLNSSMRICKEKNGQ